MRNQEKSGGEPMDGQPTQIVSVRIAARVRKSWVQNRGAELLTASGMQQCEAFLELFKDEQVLGVVVVQEGFRK